jgi:hypothetical protein
MSSEYLRGMRAQVFVLERATSPVNTLGDSSSGRARTLISLRHCATRNRCIPADSDARERACAVAILNTRPLPGIGAVEWSGGCERGVVR